MAALPSARRVLIVDDERDIRTTLHAVFGSAGYDCRTAPNGREAARLFEAEGSPLTITDLKMPVMDGLQLLRHLKARDADAAVIMLNGRPDDAFIQNTLFRHNVGESTIVSGWTSDEDGPDFVSPNTFQDTPGAGLDGCAQTLWRNAEGYCPETVEPDCGP